MRNSDNALKWRFWPVILLSSFYTLNSSLIMLGIPIFFFQEGVGLEIIGLISAAQIIAYCFSPMLFNKLSDKLGRKKSLIISMVGVSLAQITYYIFLDSIAIFTERFVEGIFLGLFGPNLQASISDNPSLDHSRYLSRLSLSFNLGGLFGLLFGAFILFFINNMLLIFYISPILMVANAVVAIFFFQESKRKDTKQYEHHEAEKGDIALNIDSSNEIIRIYIPVLIPIILLFGFSFATGSANFIYPIKSEILGFEPYSAYFLSFLAMLTQTIATYKANLWSVKRLTLTSLISLILLSIMIVGFALNEWFYGFIFLFIIIGLLAGVLYGAAMKYFMILNITKKTSRYSSIMESLTGISFFTTQLTAGFIGGFSLELAFIILSIILLMIFIINLALIRKIKE